MYSKFGYPLLRLTATVNIPLTSSRNAAKMMPVMFV